MGRASGSSLLCAHLRILTPDRPHRREQGEGVLDKLDVAGGSDPLKVGQVDEVATPPHVVAEVDALDTARREAIEGLTRLDQDEAVAEHDPELAQVEAATTSHEDVDGVRGEAPAVVVAEGGDEHQVRPEAGLLLAATCVSNHRTHAPLKDVPAALGSAVGLVDVLDRERAQDAHGGGPGLDLRVGEQRAAALSTLTLGHCHARMGNLSYNVSRILTLYERLQGSRTHSTGSGNGIPF